MDKVNANVLDRLFTVIVNRREADPDKSYVARQLQAGTSRIAQKVGEEAVETALAAVSRDEKELASESADLLFHLMILWADGGLTPSDVYAELIRREGISGFDSKKAGKRKTK